MPPNCRLCNNKGVLESPRGVQQRSNSRLHEIKPTLQYLPLKKLIISPFEQFQPSNADACNEIVQTKAEMPTERRPPKDNLQLMSAIDQAMDIIADSITPLKKPCEAVILLRLPQMITIVPTKKKICTLPGQVVWSPPEIHRMVSIQLNIPASGKRIRSIFVLIRIQTEWVQHIKEYDDGH